MGNAFLGDSRRSHFDRGEKACRPLTFKRRGGENSVEILKSHKVAFKRENFGPYDQSLGSIKFLNLVDSTIALCRILLSNHYYVYLRTALILWTEMKILMVGKLSPLFHEVAVILPVSQFQKNRCQMKDMDIIFR